MSQIIVKHKVKDFDKKKNIEGNVMQLIILGFWAIFWFLNVIDKFIGGPTFLWVGKDFFALLTKFFSSMGLTSPIIPTIALIIISAIEILAFILCVGALLFFISGHKNETRTWYFFGTLSGLLLFTFLTLGDQTFGDRFQLLEHTMFWVAILVSWGAFVWINKDLNLLSEISWKKYAKDFRVALLLVIVLTAAAITILTNFSYHSFPERTSALHPIKVGEGIYRFDFPFLGGKTVWEKSLNKFVKNNPDLKVTYVYTAPSELETKKKDNLMIYIFTEKK